MTAHRDQECIHKQLMAEKMQVEAGAQREEKFEEERIGLRKGLNAMAHLLEIKVGEKELYQREIAAMQEEYNVAHAMTRAAKASELRAKEQEKDLRSQSTMKNHLVNIKFSRQNFYNKK